jgi:hypothetical protein
VTLQTGYLWDDQDGHGARRLPERLADPAERARGVAAARAEYRAVLQTFAVGAGPERFLRANLAECRAVGVPVALLLMPESEEFRAWYPPAAERGVAAFLDRLKADCNVPVIDARAWVDDADFWDGHHLLPGGAAAFSGRLAGALSAMWPHFRGGRP